MIWRYLEYEEILEYLLEQQVAHPQIARLEEIGRSCSDRPIMAVRISGADDQAPAVLFVGGIHGNERIGVMMVLRLIEELLGRYESDPRIASLVNSKDIRLIPVANPDGYVLSRRRNARGVDLNRNFAVAFSNRGLLSRHQKWLFYPGPYPYSEPETQAIMSLLKSRRFSVALSFHSFGGRILFPWGHTRRKPKDVEVFKKLSGEMRRRQPLEKYRIERLSWFYGLRGCLEDELYGNWGTLPFLVEIMGQKRRLLKPGVLKDRFRWFNPAEDEMQAHLENNIEAALHLLEIAGDLQVASMGSVNPP